MSEVKCPEEYDELLDRLLRAERLAVESQSEAAVYLESLRECYSAAEQAIAAGKVTLLYEITGKLAFNSPSKVEGEQLGRYFLDAYLRDARCLQNTKEALEQIKTIAASLPEDSEHNTELKKRIIDLADRGLITHA